MTGVTADGPVRPEPTSEFYRVYPVSDQPLQMQSEWIIEGKDGTLYVVPAEPGGWMRRSEYARQAEQLQAVSQEEARSICWTLYGDVGPVSMEGADLEPH